MALSSNASIHSSTTIFNDVTTFWTTNNFYNSNKWIVPNSYNHTWHQTFIINVKNKLWRLWLLFVLKMDYICSLSQQFPPIQLCILKANFESLTSKEVFSEAACGQTWPEELLHIKAADVSVSGISQTLDSERRQNGGGEKLVLLLI